MKRRYFGTDGVRGPFDGPVVNAVFFSRLAAAAVHWLRASDSARAQTGHSPRVLVGRDTRASGVVLENAVRAGLRSAGAEPVSLGVLPTPAVSRAVKHTGADLGMVITASHNPAADNGIKFFGPGGLKLTDADELAIEQHLGAAMEIPELPPVHSTDATEDYIATMAGLFPAGSLAGWRIVLDAANGATARTSPTVMHALGAEVVSLGIAPDGCNINAGVGSEYPQLLSATVRRTGANLGIAHDGDGDRCVLCDELGGVLDGDEILTILGVHALKQDRLPGKILVVTVQSNLGVDAAITAHGGKVLRTAVGDRYVIERMLATGATLGGESSGHIICAEVATTGDGLVAALKVIEVMLATGLALSELRQCLRKFPQQTAGLRVKEKRSLATCPTLTAEIQALEAELGARGRVLVRYSGTEAKLRLLVEGPSPDQVEGALARLEAAARADLVVL